RPSTRLSCGPRPPPHRLSFPTRRSSDLTPDNDAQIALLCNKTRAYLKSGRSLFNFSAAVTRGTAFQVRTEFISWLPLPPPLPICRSRARAQALSPRQHRLRRRSEEHTSELQSRFQ